MNCKHATLASAIAFALGLPATSAYAQSNDKKEPSTLDTLIVTGTHVTDRTVAESQSPIDIISPEQLASTGTSELATALSRALPSLNFPRPALNDGSNGVRPAQLRGLSPDQALVLVNGKRRHTSAQINVNGGIGSGSSAVDLNAIPMAAIERVEVLRDGASALYGSDAIAGVVNIVLKGSGSGGSLSLDGGQYSAGDGAKVQLTGDAGMTFAGGRGTVHFAGQASHQDITNRGGAFTGPANLANTSSYPGIGEKAYIYGDPEVLDVTVSANGAFKFNDAVSLYGNAMVGNRDIDSFALYRSKTYNGETAVLSKVYPNGFVPHINQLVKNRSMLLGVKGRNEGGFTWDISYNYGYNRIDFTTSNSINFSFGESSPTTFYDGALEYTQNVLNADFGKSLDWGLAYPVTLSFGAEYRMEKWNESPGEYAAWANGGKGNLPNSTATAQGFGGFSPASSGHYDRHNYSAYLSLEADLTEKLSAGLAGRYENYSDFGSKVSGKLSARYAFTDTVALRGTVSSGFRAPSLPQQHYQIVNTLWNGASGKFLDAGTFPVDTEVAKALGSQPLKAENSLSYSFGLVLQPVDRLYITIDAYQIEIGDRIIFSSSLTDAPVLAKLAQLGYNNVSSVRYFTNAADTRSRGVDFVGTYTVPLAASSLDLTLSYGMVKNKVTDYLAQPQALIDIGSSQTIISRTEIGRIEKSSPKDKFIAGGTWKSRQWEVGLTATRYGSFSSFSSTPANDQTFGAKWVLDASASFKPDAHWTLTLGASNFLDQYPEETIYVNSAYGTRPYTTLSPFGFNGAYAFGRVRYAW